MSEEATNEAMNVNKAREAAARHERARSNIFKTVDTPSSSVDSNAAQADVRLRRDHIEDVLNLGSFPVHDLAHNQVGWSNQRLDLLVAAEQRRLLDTYDHTPSREEAIVSMLHSVKGLSPEQKLELALKDKNSDPSVLRALLVPKQRPAQKMAQEFAQPEFQSVPQTAEPVYNEPPQQAWARFNLPSMPAQQPATATPSNDKIITLGTPMGRINLSVLDVVPVPDKGFAVIIQRETAPFVFVPPCGHEKYVIDGIPHPVEFSGVSFVYNGIRSTVMVMVN